MTCLSKLSDIVSGLDGEMVPVGSRVTCVPAPVDTDADYLVFVGAWFGLKRLRIALRTAGWHEGVGIGEKRMYAGMPDFACFRLGELNVIATADKEFYRRFLAATAVAKKFNLLKKEDRVLLFQAVLYGNGTRG